MVKSREFMLKFKRIHKYKLMATCFLEGLKLYTDRKKLKIEAPKFYRHQKLSFNFKKLKAYYKWKILKYKAYKMRSLKIYGIFYKMIKSKYISKRADKLICKKYKILVMKWTFNNLKRRIERRRKINDFVHSK